MSCQHFTVRHALRSELSHVLAVQRRAFGRVAQEFSIEPQQLEPLRETLDGLYRAFDEGACVVVAVDSRGRIVGSVRGASADGVVMVNRLVVEDGWERQGLGTRLMDELERSFPEARLFRLFTGSDATGPLALYRKRGYQTARVQDMGEFKLVWLEKVGPNAVS